MKIAQSDCLHRKFWQQVEAINITFDQTDWNPTAFLVWKLWWNNLLNKNNNMIHTAWWLFTKMKGAFQKICCTIKSCILWSIVLERMWILEIMWYDTPQSLLYEERKNWHFFTDTWWRMAKSKEFLAVYFYHQIEQNTIK